MLFCLLTKCCAEGTLELFSSTWVVALKGQIATEIVLVLGTLTVTATVTVSRQPLDRSLAENTAS